MGQVLMMPQAVRNSLLRAFAYALTTIHAFYLPTHVLFFVTLFFFTECGVDFDLPRTN